VNEATCQQIVIRRSGGVCERCGRERATGKHHRVKRSHGGQWTPSNVVDLCGSGTTGCRGWVEANPALAGAQAWTLLSEEDPMSVPLAHAMMPGFMVLLDDAGCLVMTAAPVLVSDDAYDPIPMRHRDVGMDEGRVSAAEDRAEYVADHYDARFWE
jgi:hypothetical protein